MKCIECYIDTGLLEDAEFIYDGTSLCGRHMKLKKEVKESNIKDWMKVMIEKMGYPIE